MSIYILGPPPSHSQIQIELDEEWSPYFRDPVTRSDGIIRAAGMADVGAAPCAGH